MKTANPVGWWPVLGPEDKHVCACVCVHVAEGTKCREPHPVGGPGGACVAHSSVYREVLGRGQWCG